MQHLEKFESSNMLKIIQKRRVNKKDVEKVYENPSTFQLSLNSIYSEQTNALYIGICSQDKSIFSGIMNLELFTFL